MPLTATELGKARERIAELLVELGQQTHLLEAAVKSQSPFCDFVIGNLGKQVAP